jgi:bifunctional DNase/RNase
MSENPGEPDGEFFEARIDSVSVTQMGFIVFLKGDDENRVLPIFIGANEAQSIALALNQQTPPRPMTHDLFKTVLEALDAAVTRVEVTEIKDNTFFGRVYLKKAQIEDMDFDARPSDAMALALRWGAPIFVSRSVFDAASVTVPQSEEIETKPESENNMPETPTLSPAEKLREALRKAVSEEHYEEAARLRDELKKLQTEN